MASIADLKSQGEIIEVSQTETEIKKEIFTYVVETIDKESVTRRIAQLEAEKAEFIANIDARIAQQQALLA